MPNPNYLAARKMEQERVNHYRALGFDASRSAGSKGPWDVVVIDWKRGITTAISCKIVDSLTEANRIMRNFRAKPPRQQHRDLHQRLEVKVRGSKEIHGVTI